jgi:hypothetical protein
MTDASGDGPSADAPREEPRPEPATDESTTEEAVSEVETPAEEDAGAPSVDKGKAVATAGAPETKPLPTAEDGRESDTEDEDDEEEDDSEADDDDQEEDEEPRLKYARLTQHLGPVYRNGDATSSFLVAGDKMVRMRSLRPADLANLLADCWDAQWQHQCRRASYISVSASLPCPLRVRHRRLHIAVPPSPADIDTRTPHTQS